MEELKTIGALGQIGAFGLLSFLVIWATRFLPKRLEAADEVRKVEAAASVKTAADYKEAMKTASDSHVASNKDSLTVFSAELKLERQGCEKRHDELVGLLAKHYDLSREINHCVRDLLQGRMMERAAREKQGQIAGNFNDVIEPLGEKPL